MPIDQYREGYPDDLTITFSDSFVDTSVSGGFGRPARPAKFQIVAHTPGGDKKLKFILFEDPNTINGTINYVSNNVEYIYILTGPDSLSNTSRVTWKVTLADASTSTTPPGQGDIFEVKFKKPLGVEDVFFFTTRSEKIDPAFAQQQEDALEPYVVPNPYVGSASFEPQRFAVSGRGERKIEFRGLPRNCMIRIYTVRGELVETLEHNGSMDGFVVWDLRSKDNLDVAPGLYIYHVEAADFEPYIGKFALIK
ncbi:MAG TPA: hypothetical protein VGA55_06635, partial [Bacteroidota bacterium]